jgi:large subunit ribosomal protein L15
MEMNSMPRFGGEHHRGKRFGNGAGSGHGGSTSGRGRNGANARTGGGKGRDGFRPYSGVPEFRKQPTRGFNNDRFRNPEFAYAIVNVGDFEKMTEEVIDLAVMKAAGLISDENAPTKVLAGGDLTRKITVRAHRFSASAKERIEALGGRAEEVEAPRQESQGSSYPQNRDRDASREGYPQQRETSRE